MRGPNEAERHCERQSQGGLIEASPPRLISIRICVVGTAQRAPLFTHRLLRFRQL
jgi:hypothetical protein